MEVRKMIRGKKLLSVALVGAMLLSATACNLFAKVNPEEIIDAADSFAKSVAAFDGKKILKNVEDMDKGDAEDFKSRLSMLDLDSDERELKKTIAGTIEYEVDEESVDIKKDSATCDVEFSIVDYADATGDLAGKPEDFMDAITSCKKTKDYTVSLEFTKVEDDWLVTADSLDELDDLFSFIDYEFEFVLFDLSDFDEALWYTYDGYKDVGYYEDCWYLELDVWFFDVPGVAMYYEVYYNGTLMYTSRPEDIDSTCYEIWIDENIGVELTDDWYMPEGVYTVKVYTEDGLLVTENDATVVVNDYGGGSGGGGSSGEFDDSGFSVYDDSFADIVDIGWTDYGDAGYYGEGLFGTDVSGLGMYISIDGTGPELYYEVYYLGDFDNLSFDLDNMVDSGYVSPVASTYYIDYKPDSVEPGVYYFVVGESYPGMANDPYIAAIAMVI